MFAKALNCHEFGVHSVSDEKRISIEVLKDFDTFTYKEPTYFVVDLSNKKEN